MRATAGRPVVSRRRWVGQASVLALTIAVGSFTLVAGSPHSTPHPAAVGRSAGTLRLGVPATSATTASPGTAPAPADLPVVAPAAEPSAARLRPAVHTMSMDAAIQGGMTAHQEQQRSARVLAAHTVPTSAPRSEYWTRAEGRTAVRRAESWLGMPYSWAGGSATGPTLGHCDTGTGGDLDCHVVGFDCSGLAMYAWGPYEALPHLAATQRLAGAFHPTVAQLLPGDLVFFAGYLPGGTGHVAIYAGHGMVVEAPQSGSAIRRTPLTTVMSEDGAYRGAVRPMSGATPTLTGRLAAVPTGGGLVTLKGTGLAGVDAVRVGGATVRTFEQHSDSSIVFRAPAHHAGTVGVSVTTSWYARSGSSPLTYSRPSAPVVTKAPVKRVSPVAPPTSTSPPPVSLAPPSTPPTAPPSKRTPSSAPSSTAPAAPSATPTPAPSG